MTIKITQKKTTREWLNNDPMETIVSDAGNAFVIEAPQLTSEQMRATVESLKDETTPTGKIRGVKNNESDGLLTPKQRMFVSLVTQGNAPRDAYRKAYSAVSQNEATIGAAANRLMNLGKVKRLLSHYWSKQEKNIILDQQRTRLHIMEELLKHSNDVEHPINARLKALEMMGKAVGMFTDKVETKVEQISAEQLKTELSQHLALLDQTVIKH